MKKFDADKGPDGVTRYYVDAELVSHAAFVQRREAECQHRWESGKCKDCGLPKDK